MKKSIAIIAMVLFISACGKNYCSYVNLFAGSDGNGHCHPCACLPFGAIQVGPQTGNCTWDYCGGYQWRDTVIQGFSQNRIDGTGSSELGDLLIMPFTGDALKQDYSSKFNKSTEKAEPGYYRCHLDDFGITAETTCSPHVSLLRFTPDNPEECVRMLVDLQSAQIDSERMLRCRVLDGNADWGNDTGSTHIKGYTHSKAWNDRVIYYDMEFSRPFTIEANLPLRDSSEFYPRKVLNFGASKEPLMVKACISISSIEGASRTMADDLPGWNFESIRKNATKVWNERLGTIDITADEQTKRVFYTCMYHLMMHPNNIADSGEEAFYSNMSLWDTFRAAHPLFTIIAPDVAQGVVASFPRYYDKQGFLPMWTVSGTDNFGMIGNHSIPIIVDAYLKGLTGFDPELLYQQIKSTLTVSHIKCDWEAYDRCGYFPYDVTKVESASRTLECCYDDYCAAKMARALGHDEDAEFFEKRAGYWKNLMDPDYKLIRSRDSEGGWDTPFDPLLVGHHSSGGAFTEGNSWQYSWHVLHDADGLAEAMGGREAFLAKLDSLFTMPSELHSTGPTVDVSGLIGQYAHGNEPSHHVIYLYALNCEKEKAANLIRKVCTEQYIDAPDGLSGNDDCGQMSAWYIFSTLGFYPVNPCGGDYVVVEPLVEKACINLPGGGHFDISPETLKEKNILLHSDIVKGN